MFIGLSQLTRDLGVSQRSCISGRNILASMIIFLILSDTTIFGDNHESSR